MAFLFTVFFVVCAFVFVGQVALGTHSLITGNWGWFAYSVFWAGWAAVFAFANAAVAAHYAGLLDD